MKTPPSKRIDRNICFCSFCGRKLEMTLVGAETIYEYYADYPTGVVAPSFDSKTGKRNWCRRYICPEWKEVRWWQWPSEHDHFTENKVVKLSKKEKYKWQMDNVMSAQSKENFQK